MTNKRKLHHVHVKLRPIKSIYIFICLLIALGVGVYSLRQNNLTVIRMRDHVLEVDKKNGDIETALHDIREYIYGHMNTDLAAGPNAIKPPIQLKYSYERLLAAEKARVSAVNAKVYADAQAICEQRYPAGPSIVNRVPCTQDYVAANGVKEQPIQDALYKFEFLSPVWTPDVAGISLLISAILSIVLIVKLFLNHWLKKQLHDHL